MKREITLQLTSFLLGLLIWIAPVPDGLATDAWHLFAIFAATIFAVVSGAATILLASVVALVTAIFTGTMEPEIAYSGFSQPLILLIIIAFLVGKGVVNSGLGIRIANLMVRSFGKSSLGLAYCMVATDALIAPAFPSNTARSGVLFPIVFSLARSNDSHPDEDSRKRIGAYLMMSSMAGIGLSSGLWLTAMAANPAGVALAARNGVDINFATWFMAASVPMLTCMVAVPWLLYKTFPPEITSTPEAPRAAADQLRKLGRFSRKEWTTSIAFMLMVAGWAFSSVLSLDAASVAFAGLAVLMLTGVITPADIQKSGDALATLIWFGILYTLSTELDALGFMQYAGDRLGNHVSGFGSISTFVLLGAVYVLLHYLFVSQTAHLLALFGVFLGLSPDQVPTAVMAMTLLLANNYFSVMTPQASSANVIFVSSGYLQPAEVYRYGGLVTVVCFIICLMIGTPWFYFVLT